MTDTMRTAMYFMEKDPLFLTEKPYELNYEPNAGHSATNMKIKKAEDLQVLDIRSKVNDFSFQKNGFQIMRIDSKMSRKDFDCKAKIIEIYFSEVAEMLKKTLGASRVQVFDYSIRKRQDQFPICTGGFYKYKQPSSIVHVDTTPKQTREIIQRMNPDHAESLLNMQYQYINVWKPLRGPVEDWPLALCDPNTVDINDYVARDFVDVDSFIETYHLYQKSSQKWYYLSAQTEQEAWIFLQSDSEPGSMMGVPHCSFPLTFENGFERFPRESIEVRALAFYEKF